MLPNQYSKNNSLDARKGYKKWLKKLVNNLLENNRTKPINRSIDRSIRSSWSIRSIPIWSKFRFCTIKINAPKLNTSCSHSSIFSINHFRSTSDTRHDWTTLSYTWLTTKIMPNWLSSKSSCKKIKMTENKLNFYFYCACNSLRVEIIKN